MSEGLKSLENIKKVKVDKDGPFSATFLGHDKRYCNDLSIIEQELKAKEQSDKALEIIKEILDDDLFSKLNSNSRKIIKEIIDKLPKEKLDLLKEVLE